MNFVRALKHSALRPEPSSRRDVGIRYRLRGAKRGPQPTASSNFLPAATTSDPPAAPTDGKLGKAELGGTIVSTRDDRGSSAVAVPRVAVPFGNRM